MHPCVAMLVHAHTNESLSIPWFFQIHVPRNTDQLLLSCFTTVIVRLSVHHLLAFFRWWRRTWTTRHEQQESDRDRSKKGPRDGPIFTTVGFVTR
jgi:hypothetical protein